MLDLTLVVGLPSLQTSAAILRLNLNMKVRLSKLVVLLKDEHP